MKKIAIAILATMSFSCKAQQNPILDINQLAGTESITGAYYKDTHLLLNPFEGTYVYNFGDKMLKIVLQKKEMSSINGRYFEDVLIGEYQYLVNGVEKVNTLNKLDINYPNKRLHNIKSNLIITEGDIGCSECLPNEKALMGSLVDGASNNTAQLTIRKVMVNGQEAIKIFIIWQMTAYSDNAPGVRASIPGGDYTLIKQ